MLLVISLVGMGLLNTGRVEASKKAKPDHTEGALTAVDANGKPLSSCPLKHTTVKAAISGFMSRVVVTQEFENPFEEKIEAVYTFPLPQAAAVDDMTIVIGDRVVRGKIMTREEARATYDAARSSGKVAGLLDQERPNIFTQSVANITPGQPIKVTISYVETLKYEEGSYEFTFPMVVGERYIPASMSAKRYRAILLPKTIVRRMRRESRHLKCQKECEPGLTYRSRSRLMQACPLIALFHHRIRLVFKGPMNIVRL